MYQQNQACLKPEELKGCPAACPPEQISECYGEVPGHAILIEKSWK
jgi:hypothetical protein